MSSVPALTTTFVPSPSCTIDIYMESFSTGLICAVGTQIVPCNYYHLGVDSSTSDCFPSGWASTSDAYFSPGICPSGYTQACQNVTGSETRATCCPTGFECGTDTYWPWYVTNLCTYPLTTSQVLVYTTSILGEGNAVFTSTEDNQGINAFGIQIRYQSTDFVSSSSTAAPSSTATSSTASVTGQSTGSGSSSSASPTGTGNSSGDSSSSSSGLSTGAKAGIGIGVALGVLALLGCIVFLFVRKRRAAAAAADAGDGDDLGGALGSDGPSSGGHRVNSMASPGSGIAYTAVSTGSPAPEQQKYYSGDSTAVPPMAEAPTDAPWTMPAELPAEHSQRY
ncbi:hypothetical protein SEPCBS57363_001686 [Sporothrix epigloea]|uniref:Uncharacterized protein n=1 Tax=Sporothrix epigloea TaxID=1892477 RepID=A0ABP0DBP4_9PEZI